MRLAKEPPVSIVSFGKLRVIAIFCCFGYVIYNANDKLQSGTIGTTLNTVNSKVVQYPPITACVYRDIRKKYYDEVNAGGIEGEAIDEIRNMTEFPADTRTDLITHLSYNHFSNGSYHEHNLEINTNAIQGLFYSHRAVFGGPDGYDYMASCVTFTSPSRVPAGQKYQQSMRFNVSDATQVNVYAHNMDQAFFPSGVKVYGSALKTVSLSGNCWPANQVIFISRTHKKAMDQPLHRCTSDTTNPNTSACIASYITDKIGCQAKVEGNQHYNGTSLCRTKAQLLALRDMTNTLQEANGNEIYDMAGCLSACSKDHYSISAEPLKYDGNVGSCELSLTAIMADRSYEEREEYLIYDEWSFIADVGGYMGLLLGYSLLSLCNDIEVFLKKIIRKACS